MNWLLAHWKNRKDRETRYGPQQKRGTVAHTKTRTTASFGKRAVTSFKVYPDMVNIVDLAKDRRGESDPLLKDPLLQRVLEIALAAPHSILSDVTSWHGHVPFAQALVALARPRLVVELGVHKGDSYRAFTSAMARYEVDGRAFGVDTWQGDEHAGNYDGNAILREVSERNAPYAAFSQLLQKTFDEAATDFADGSIDLLHIDGLHTYEAVRHDFETWRPKLSERGIALFHDTVVRRDDFGVFRFWDEVKDSWPSFNFRHSNGLGVLYPENGLNEDARAFLRLLKRSGEAHGTPLDLLTVIGEAYAGRAAASIFQNIYRLKEIERQDNQQRAAAEIKRLNHEIVTIRGEQQAAAEERSFLAGERKRLQTELKAAEQERDHFASQFRNALETYRKLENEHHQLAAAYRQIETDRDHFASQFGDALETYRRLSEEHHQLGTAHRQVLQTHDEFVTELATGKASLQQLSEERQDLERKATALEDDLAAAHARQAQIETSAAAEIEHMRGELASAQQARDAAGMELAAYKRRSLAGRTGAAVRFAKRGTLKAVRVTGRTALNSLPLSHDARTRLKYRIISRIGPYVGVGTGRRSYDLSSSTQVLLHNAGEHYLDVSRSATGKPSYVPPRSVSIIIPVHNQIDYTLRCLMSIARNTADVEHEIILVDDCSSDETPTLLSQRDDLVFLRNEKNLGFIGSCNAGLRRAKKNYVVYLNNDTEVGPDWLSALINTFELNDHVGMVGAKLIYPDGKLQEAGGLIWDDFSGWNWGRMQDPEDPRYNYVRHADYCSGAALLLPRSLAEALGGFDPHFTPAYGEDSDLAFKVRTLGLSVLYQPLSQVVHYEGVSSGTDVTKGVKAYQVVNAQKLAARWEPVLPHQGKNGEDAEFAADRGRIGRILVIDQITPEPDRDAGSITALELMRALRDFGYKITFIPCSNFTYIPNYTDMLAALGIESVLYPWTRSVREHLERVGSRYDAVVIFRLNTASDHLATVRELAPQAKIIFHTSDLHFLREERAQAVDNPDLPERSHAARKTKKNELNVIKKSDVTIVHSHFERGLLSELLPKSNVVVFPWLYEPRGAGLPLSERRDLVFLGGYRHYPNVDAVLAFAQNILPLLLPRFPDIIFHAVGSHPPEELTRLASRNIRIAGFIEDISPTLWGARMMVAPLRYGAGLKGKIVTAMAHGLPVITTTIGAEGMGLTDGVDVLIADTPAEIAAAIERLDGDHTLWHSLSEAGLDYVVRTTSREAGYKIVGAILESAGLPALPRLAQKGESHTFQAAFGSPRTLADPQTLLAAATQDHPQTGLLIVPPSLEGIDIEGWKVAAIGDESLQAERIVAIVDSTSDAEVSAIADRLPKAVLPGGRASIVFAPPRMAASDAGYHLTRPFADARLDDTVEPPHLRHGARLAKLDGTLTWRADATILGFPSVMVADWEP